MTGLLGLSSHTVVLTGRHGYLISFVQLKLTFLGDVALASGRQPHHDDTYLRVLGLHADAISLARHVDGFAVAQKARSCDRESWKPAGSRWETNWLAIRVVTGTWFI